MPEQRLAQKHSNGIILCRVNQTSGRVEALLVRKRYTYDFVRFVHGHYPLKPRPRAGRQAPESREWKRDVSRRDAPLRRVTVGRPVRELLEGMTREELLDVLSLNFRQMWYRIWLASEGRGNYGRKCARFEEAFLGDGGAALRAAVLATRPRGVLLWEPPRGRPATLREGDLPCAMRELQEETGVKKDSYRILPGVERRISYVCTQTCYSLRYFTAVATTRVVAPEQATLRDLSAMSEVGDIEWADAAKVRALDTGGSRLSALVGPILRHVKRFCKWGPRLHSRPAQHFSQKQASDGS